MIDDYPSDMHVSDNLSQAINLRISATRNSPDDSIVDSAIELDSHADSPVVGKVARIIKRHDKSLFVSGFTDKLGKPLRVPIVDASVVYECNRTGMKYVIVIHNANKYT